MQKPDTIRIRHMLDAAMDIQTFTMGRTRQGFEKDRMRAFAVIHLFEILGEAASSISEETIKSNPQVRWRDIINMRNRLIHGYHDINLDIIWKTAQEDIPVLIDQLEDLISEHS